MAYLIDIIKEDLKSLDQIGFHELDACFFSILSYFPLENKQIDLDQLARPDFLHIIEKSQNIEENKELFRYIILNPRYKNLKILHVHEDYIPNKAKMFAYCIEISENTILVCYRGTEASLTSWEETLSYIYSSKLACQEMAKNYLEFISKTYPDKKIIVTGHSKGGNLAVYAGLNATNLDDQLLVIYDLDGPGFFTYEGFFPRENKIKKFVSSKSIVGRFLKSPSPIEFVESRGVLWHAHFLHNWKILDGKLQRSRQVDLIAEKLAFANHELLKIYTQDELKEICQSLIFLARSANLENLLYLHEHFLSASIELITALSKLEERRRNQVLEAVDRYRSIITGKVSSDLSKRIKEKIKQIKKA